MKRRIKCATCHTRINSATGKPLYLLGGDNHTMLHTASKTGECWDCGEKRRSIEEEKRQRFLTRLVEGE